MSNDPNGALEPVGGHRLALVLDFDGSCDIIGSAMGMGGFHMIWILPFVVPAVMMLWTIKGE